MGCRENWPTIKLNFGFESCWFVLFEVLSLIAVVHCSFLWTVTMIHRIVWLDLRWGYPVYG